MSWSECKKAGANMYFLHRLAHSLQTHHSPDSACCMYVCVPVRRALVSPVVTGAENLPDPLGPRRPLLFIGKAQLLVCIEQSCKALKHALQAL